MNVIQIFRLDKSHKILFNVMNHFNLPKSWEGKNIISQGLQIIENGKEIKMLIKINKHVSFLVLSKVFHRALWDFIKINKKQISPFC